MTNFIKGPMKDDGSYTDSRRVFFDNKNKLIHLTNTPVKYLFFGDSITELLEETVFLSTPEGLTINRGIAGDTANFMKERLKADVLQLKPENLILLAGTNDLAQMIVQGIESEENMIHRVYNDLIHMVEQALEEGIQVYLCAIPPTNEAYQYHREKKQLIPAINKRLEEYAKGQEGVVYVDYYSALVDENQRLIDDYSRDGLHISGEGYRVMRETLYNWIDD